MSQHKGTKQANNQMQWMLKKGQDLEAKSKSHATLDLFMYFWQGDTRRASSDLLATDLDKVPARSKDKVNQRISLTTRKTVC